MFEFVIIYKPFYLRTFNINIKYEEYFQDFITLILVFKLQREKEVVRKIFLIKTASFDMNFLRHHIMQYLITVTKMT